MSSQQTNVKYRAHYPLKRVRELIDEGRFEATATARRGIRSALKINIEEALPVLLSLTPKDLDKSMTDVEKKAFWQDVYKRTHDGVALYIKLQIKPCEECDGDCVRVISFKKDDGL